jgi:hypothetical protein
VERRFKLRCYQPRFLLFAEILIQHGRNAGHLLGKFLLAQPRDFIRLRHIGGKAQADLALLSFESR